MNVAETQILDLADQTIAYAETPGHGGHPLVLLHGGVVDHRMWAPQMSAFPGRRVLAPDARGHGGSSDAGGPYRLTDDVIALLDALDIEEAVLAGISMGGGTAVDTLLEHPDRVAAAVVSGTGTSEADFTDPWILDVLAQWGAAQERADVDGWLAAFMRLGAGPGRDLSDVDPEVRDLIGTMARDTVEDHLRSEDGTPVPPIPPTPVTGTWQRARDIAVPVLGVSGTLDGDDHRRMCRQLTETVPRGEHVEIPGGAHYPNLENRSGFDRTVREFLDRHDL